MVVPIQCDADIVLARHEARRTAAAVGFTGSNLTIIATAVSELARNILEYAGSGEVHLSRLSELGRPGIGIVAVDRGPGIADLKLAMTDGFSTGRSLGIGLPGARRLLDRFEIESTPGRGTTVRGAKWLP